MRLKTVRLIRHFNVFAPFFLPPKLPSVANKGCKLLSNAATFFKNLDYIYQLLVITYTTNFLRTASYF